MLNRTFKTMRNNITTMKGILFCLVLILLVSNVSALSDLGKFKQGDTVRITQVCDDATYINISSISYPNSTNATSPIAMINVSNGEFYYNFDKTNTLGRYDVRGVSDGCERTFATYFIIDNNTLTIFIIMSVLAFLFLIISLFGNTEFFLFCSGILFEVTAVLIMIFGISTLSDMYTRSIAFVYIAVGVLLMVGSYLDFGSFGFKTQEEEE